MAYALDFGTGGSDAYLARPSTTSSSIPGVFRFSVEFTSFSAVQTMYYGPSSTRNGLEVLNATQIRHRFNNSAQVTLTLPFTLQVNTRYLFEVIGITVPSNTMELWINGELIRTVADSGGYLWSRFGNRSGGSRFTGRLYYIEQTDSTGNILRFENTTGAGLELAEQNLGGESMPLVGTWPSDNSQWDPYDDGTGGTDQDITVNTATQTTTVVAIALSTGQTLNLIPAQQLATCLPISLTQIQSVSSQSAGQVTQSNPVTVLLSQQLSSQPAQQVTAALIASVQQSQQLSVLAGQQVVSAGLINIDQSGAIDITVYPAEQVTAGASVALSLNQQVSVLSGVQLATAQLIEIGTGKPAMAIEVLPGSQVVTSGFVTLQLAQNIASVEAQQAMSAVTIPLSQSLTISLPEAQQRTVAALIVWGDKVIDPCKVRLTRKRSDFVLLKTENAFILNHQRQEFILRSKCNV